MSGRPRDRVLEIDDDLEERVKVGIELLEHVEELAFADEHDLEPERHWLGLERRGGHEAHHLPQRLDSHLLAEQRALERVPGERLDEQVARVEDEVAAVGAVQGTRLHQVEVRDQRPHVRSVLDAPHEVLDGRVVLVDDGGAVRPRVIDEEIDEVAAVGRHAGLARAHAVGAGRVVSLPDEVAAVQHDLLAENGEMLDDRRDTPRTLPSDRR